MGRSTGVPFPAPDWSQNATGEKQAPKDRLELTLIRIWEKVLGVSNIGVDDNYFDLGGHSVLAVRLMTEIEKVVGRKIPLTSSLPRVDCGVAGQVAA